MGAGNRVVNARSGGLIGFYGLTAWWDATFSVGEQGLIRETCDPEGATSLTRGRIWESSGTAVQLLNGLSHHFMSGAGYPLAIRLAAKALDIGGDGSVMDQHYTYERLIELMGTTGAPSETKPDLSTAACLCQIALASELAGELMREGAVRLPRHAGYERLVELREESEHFEDAIRLCRQARHEGWSGDWERALKRLKRRLGRRQSPPGDLPTEDPEITRERLTRLLQDECKIFQPKSDAEEVKLTLVDDEPNRPEGGFFGSLPPAFIDDFVPGGLDDDLTDVLEATRERDETIAALEAERETLREQLAEARRLSDFGAQDILTERKAHEDTRRERDRLKTELADAREDIAALRADFDSAEQERTRLDAEVSNHRAARASAEAACDATLARLTELEKSLETASAKANLAEEQVAFLRDEREELSAQLHSTESRLAEIQTLTGEQRAALDTFEGELVTLRAQLTERESTIAEQARTIEQIQEEATTAVDRLAAFDGVESNLAEERDALLDRVATLTEKLETAQSERDQAVSGFRQAVAELEDREASFHETLQEKITAQADKARLSVSLTELESHAAQQEHRIGELQREIDDLHAGAAQRLASLSEAIAEAGELRQELVDRDRLAEDFKRQMRERERLAEEVSRMGAEREGVIQDMEAEIDEFRDKYKTAARAQEDLEAQLEARDGKLLSLHEELDGRVTELHRVERELNHERNARANECANLNAELATREQELNALREELAAATERARVMESDIAALQGDLAVAIAAKEVAQSSVQSSIPTPTVTTPPPAVIGRPSPVAVDAFDQPTTLDGLRGEVQELRKHVTEAVQARDGLMMEIRRIQATALQHAQTPARPAAPPQQAHAQPNSTPAPTSQLDAPTILNPEWEYDPYSRPTANPASNISYECPHCRRTLKIPTQFAGWFGQCKLCGGDITVPKT